MTTLREAAIQALEALEMAEFDPHSSDAVHKAITALRAALAEPCPCGDRSAAECPGEWEPGCDLGNNPKYAKRVNLAEPDTDPVAWLWQHRETGRTRVLMPDERTATDVAAAWDVVGPLYLAPPQRKPMNEFDALRLVTESIGRLQSAGPVAWVECDGELVWNNREAAIGRNLYTAPPQRKPLTEEEIQQCFKEAGITIKGQHWTNAVRNVERAHGIT